MRNYGKPVSNCSQLSSSFNTSKGSDCKKEEMMKLFTINSINLMETIKNLIKVQRYN